MESHETSFFASTFPNLSLSKLTTNSTRRELLSVAVCEKATGVCDDLSDMEANRIVNTLSVVSAHKEWPCQAAVRNTTVIGPLRVGEG
jgi:hypothetical protein